MLARLQKIITLTLAVSALCWLAYFYGKSPVWAVVGFVLITSAYSALFAIEFILLRAINKRDPAPQPTCNELFKAWLGETLTAPQVFFWRQPFRSNAIPDQLSPCLALTGRRGMVFVHGFFCNRGFWNPWLKRLQNGGHAYVAVNLEPVFGSIDDYALAIETAVQQVRAVTGLAPVLVCHSMGGLAARAWLKHYKGEAKVHHIVTIGTPHSGTWLARFGHGHNGRQMRLLSDWHSGLDQHMPASRNSLFTCWYGNSDNIVFPTSTATLPGADNRLIRGAAHVQMAFLPQVMNTTLALLDGKYRCV
jgi:pimeloyl-ACP methyl ester carboxylesterase